MAVLIQPHVLQFHKFAISNREVEYRKMAIPCHVLIKQLTLSCSNRSASASLSMVTQQGVNQFVRSKYFGCPFATDVAEETGTAIVAIQRGDVPK